MNIFKLLTRKVFFPSFFIICIYSYVFTYIFYNHCFVTSTVKPVYKCQPQGITKVAFVDRWPLFGASETTFSRDKLRLAFIDRKPLLAGVLMHRFDYIHQSVLSITVTVPLLLQIKSLQCVYVILL